jgi:hypothetical protein
MTAKELGDQPAYPSDDIAAYSGLTKRELMAMAALPSVILVVHSEGLAELKDHAELVAIIAKSCVNYSDALLAELAKEKNAT